MNYDFKFAHGKSMEEIINGVVDVCDKLEAEESTTIFGFGENRDLVLKIEKDCDFNREDGSYNLVTINTCQNKKYVDDTGNIYVTDGELYKELERIWNYRGFETL